LSAILSDISQDLLATLTELVNQGAQQLGLQMEIQGLIEGDMNAEKMNDKLVEIDVKLSVIKEAMDKDEVIIKSYFESD